jgi:predicted PurR-regulated permease PerM
MAGFAAPAATAADVNADARMISNVHLNRPSKRGVVVVVVVVMVVVVVVVVTVVVVTVVVVTVVVVVDTLRHPANRPSAKSFTSSFNPLAISLQWSFPCSETNVVRKQSAVKLPASHFVLCSRLAALQFIQCSTVQCGRA